MTGSTILLTGRAGSKSILAKNVYPVLGRPLAFYPMYAARQANNVDDIYLSTDGPEIASIARDMGIKVIQRPAELARDDSELVDTITHAMDAIGDDIDYLITMHCNCGVHRPGLVDECISAMEADPSADSCVTGYIDRAVHPFRTKQITMEGYLEPWLGVPEHTSTNRQKLPPCFVLDGAVRVLRVANCFPPSGQPPFSYLGNRILHRENVSGGDVHSMADIAKTEYLLRELGWTESGSMPA